MYEVEKLVAFDRVSSLRNRLNTKVVAANFIVGFVLRLQPNLVHFASDALTEMEITARHSRVWIRSTESADSSFLEIYRDSSWIRPWNLTWNFN